MPTKSELEGELKEAQDELTKFRALQYCLVRDLIQDCIACSQDAEYLLETPKREIPLCEDHINDLHCFLKDFDLELKNYREV